MSGLSLYHIEEALLLLMDSRESLQQQLDTGQLEPDHTAEETAAELAEVDKLIRQYITREVEKVDSIHGWLKRARITEQVAKQEAQEYAERARRIEANRRRLEQMVIDIMHEVGVTKLEGTAGRGLRRQGNGGLAPLMVDGWDGKEWDRPVADVVLPDSLMDITVTLPLSLLDRLRELVPEINACVSSRAPVPANGRIREVLKEGDVPGARLGDRGEQLRLT